MRAGALVSLALLFASACSSSASAPNSPVHLDVSGPQGQPIPATNFSDVLMVDLSVDAVKGRVVVDTGSPIVSLDPAVFRGTSLPNGAGTADSIAIGALTIKNPYVVGAHLFTSPDPSVPFDGSLGCGILCGFVVSLNYRDIEVTLGPAPVPSGVVDPGTTIPFSLEGGGEGIIAGVSGIVSIPRSRMVVTVTIEGHDSTLIVDSGSSMVALRKDVFSTLTKDGRTVVSGVGTATQGALSSSSLARVRSVVVGGEEIDGIVAAQDDALDGVLGNVEAEIGRSVDGLLGGSFLRNFYVTVDYPASALHLRRYAVGAPTFDAFDRVAIAIDPTNDTVSQVLAGTDASAKGVAVGDVIEAIDGQPLASLGVTAIDVLLSGPIGTTKSIKFGHAASPALSAREVPIGVSDVLPL